MINPNKIAVMGSSAGGHLAAICGNFDPWMRPNAQILCYPVTDVESHRGSYENLLGDDIETADFWSPITQAREYTPPTFIWHTSCDSLVDVKGTYRYATRLSELGVPVEMHIYPVGDHGLGLARGLYGSGTEEYVQRWTEDLEHWLKLLGWINS
jgi:acetyl esterase/lipase